MKPEDRQRIERCLEQIDAWRQSGVPLKQYTEHHSQYYPSGAPGWALRHTGAKRWATRCPPPSCKPARPRACPPHQSQRQHRAYASPRIRFSETLSFATQIRQPCGATNQTPTTALNAIASAAAP